MLNGCLALPALSPLMALAADQKKTKQDSQTSDATAPRAACDRPDFRSRYIAAGFSPSAPAFSHLTVDSLGGGADETNPVFAIQVDPASFRLVKDGNVFHYYPLFRSSKDTPVWTVECSDKKIRLRSEYHQTPPASIGLGDGAFNLAFRQKACHATLLGMMDPGREEVNLPCVLHLPDRGSLRLTSTTVGLRLGYAAQRKVNPPLVRFVNISFPCATAEHPVVEYGLEVATIYPELQGIEKDPHFDTFRRNFLNGFQVIPRRQMLGTNASSDINPFTLYMFAELGAPKVRLAEGLHTSDLVRMTAERYLSGTKGYGQNGYEVSTGKFQFAEVDPSLVLGSGIYAQSTEDWTWARKYHGEVMRLCRQMMTTDTNGSGLIKYGTTGNFGERPTRKQRPANWWDTINFGYEDAYSNALAYRALTTWASVAKVLEQREDAAWLEEKAKALRAAYQRLLLNSENGVFAGWRSADGKLHDYWFLFLNSVAVAYELVDVPQGAAIMEKFLRKLDEVGYTMFRIGLPGNLVPIPKGDSVLHEEDPNEDPRIYGVPQREDGTDAFHYYENGGASMRFAFFTLKALYRVGKLEEARKMLYPMLEGYKAGDYQGFDVNGNSNDWRTWGGQACGYEGFAVGNYLPLLNVIDEWKSRQHM